MTDEKQLFWQGFAASIPGAGHIRRGIPCQDASLVVTEPRAAVIVCDGRGSAKLSHHGAQRAVEAFRSQIAILDPFIAGLLDVEEKKEEAWMRFCRIMYRTLRQAQIDLAAEYAQPEKEFDFTVAFAITGKCYIGCFQVGDGAIVLRQQKKCMTAFAPEKGEFANQTHFLRPGGEIAGKFQYALFPVAENSGIAVTSDGPEHLMFHLPAMTPGKIFDCFFDDFAAGELQKQDVMDYLTRKEWNDDPRGADDRSIALLVFSNAETPEKPEWAEEKGESTDHRPAETSAPVPAVTEPEASGNPPLCCPMRRMAVIEVFLLFAMLLTNVYFIAENRNLRAVISEMKHLRHEEIVPVVEDTSEKEGSPAVRVLPDAEVVKEREPKEKPAASPASGASSDKIEVKHPAVGTPSKPSFVPKKE